ncbi:Sodium/hydrogen exchanger-like domain-containing protein 1 [Heterocephalus glaber]|uniref:Sodium/hydrogen exchanger-like domain-containing protein 1 n=1 Tax=Heterocephalus glaber TaxID=10181 RepID=G5BXA8_HETGA|nr:Sodium/hydrogen exchanger-like domain-containing protein 1 [Heterocephalus glaber]
MDHKKRGLALILNQEHFTPHQMLPEGGVAAWTGTTWLAAAARTDKLQTKGSGSPGLRSGPPRRRQEQKGAEPVSPEEGRAQPDDARRVLLSSTASSPPSRSPCPLPAAFLPGFPRIVRDVQVYGAYKGTKETVLYTEETIPQRKKRTCFSCPPQGIVNNIMTSGVIYFMILCILWLLSGPEVLPGGNLFRLVIIFYSARLGGTLLKLIRIPTVPPLPPLLGSAADEDRLLPAVLWSVHRRGVHRCCCFPLRHGFPLAVGVSIREAGYGIEKGIPTLLIAASSMDDVVAITGFNTVLNLIFSKGSILNNVLSTLWDVFVGVLVGTVFGLFVQYFPSEDQAVLGPLALETARLTAPHLEPDSKDVMTVAFLAILITAPNGALLISILGPRMLSRRSNPSAVRLHLPGLRATNVIAASQLMSQ